MARSASSRWKYPRPEPYSPRAAAGRRQDRHRPTDGRGEHRGRARSGDARQRNRRRGPRSARRTPLILTLDAGRVRRRRRRARGGGRGATRPDEARSIDSGTAERPPPRGGDRTSTRRGRHLPACASVSPNATVGGREDSPARPQDRTRWHPGGDARRNDAGLPAPLNHRRRTRRHPPPPRVGHGRRGSRRGRRGRLLLVVARAGSSRGRTDGPRARDVSREDAVVHRLSARGALPGREPSS